MRTLSLLVVALTLVSACGGGSADPIERIKSGEKSLGTQDFASALTDFEAALSELGSNTSDPLYMRAKLGSIEAMAATDGARAKDELLALSSSAPGAVDDRSFNRIADRLASAGGLTEAIELLDAAKKLYPEAAHLDTLGRRLLEDAKDTGDTSALDELAGLGYLE